jgi:SAM-dependent methyltransferase
VLDCPPERLGRETPSCTRCGSTVRMRVLIHLLSLALFRTSMPLPDFPKDRRIVGVGLSDWFGYADALATKFSYTNTYYHRRPRLDITSPPRAYAGSADFLIATEVFEHVPPPIDRAFRGAFAILKPGGHLILTVPYSLDAETVEHFPELHQYKIVEEHGAKVLVNKRRDGTIEKRRDLIFHGGEGETLEMRLFNEAGLQASLRKAGFDPITTMRDGVPEWGIMLPEPWSLPILARRPVQCDNAP